MTAIAAATSTSFIRAAAAADAGKIPSKVLMDLADGRKVEFVINSAGMLVARVLDAKGRVVDPTPVGRLTLKSGKTLAFDRAGRLTEGTVSDNTGFVLFCCDPDPSTPCKPCK